MSTILAPSGVMVSFSLPDRIGRLFEEISRNSSVAVSRTCAFLSGVSRPVGMTWIADAKVNTLLGYVLAYEIAGGEVQENPGEVVEVADQIVSILSGLEFPDTHAERWMFCHAEIPEKLLRAMAVSAAKQRVMTNEICRELVVEFCRKACLPPCSA